MSAVTYERFCLQRGTDARLRALAAPTRRETLVLVRDRELSAGDIAARFTLTRPAVSQHLGVLRDAGLLTERRSGTRRLYRARPAAMEEIHAFLEGVWTEGLGRLEQEAESEERRAHVDRS